jgi:radical SAM superfamily enzyme YgiQ (UPF0313 family)
MPNRTTPSEPYGPFQPYPAGTAESVNVVGLTGPTDVDGEVVWLARRLRDRGFGGTIVRGHDHASLNDLAVLEYSPDIDVVVRGEGEATMVDLVDALSRGHDLSEVRGVTWRGSRGIVRNPARHPIDLDLLPTPTRDGAAEVLRNGMSLSMFTKRGCLYRCTFCSTGQVPSALGMDARKRWRTKSAAEFMTLADDFALPHITITEDLFVGPDRVSREWAAAFGQALLDAKNRTTFMVDCRVDSFDPEVFALLRAAGLMRVFIGVENATPATRAQYAKHFGGADPQDTIRNLKSLGIDVILGFINSGPFDTMDNLRANAQFLREIEADDFQLHLGRTRVYPGTEFQRELGRRGLLSGEFPYYGYEHEHPEVARVTEAIDRLGSALHSELHSGGGLSAAQSTHLLDSEASEHETWLSDSLGQFRKELGSLLSGTRA